MKLKLKFARFLKNSLLYKKSLQAWNIDTDIHKNNSPCKNILGSSKILNNSWDSFNLTIFAIESIISQNFKQSSLVRL
jgi:hypothetical protein